MNRKDDILMSDNSQVVLDASELSKSFTRTVTVKEKKKSVKKTETFFAVENISLAVERGEILGILGPNGAGKTTLLRMLGGIMESESGSINICGLNYKESRHHIKEKIAYLSNNTKLYGRFTGREMFYSFGEMYGLEKTAISARIDELTKQLKLEKFIDNRIETMSTGQTQRINIARCLIHSPELYILDEPTLGLDIISSKDIIDFMHNEKSAGKSVIYSTHYMEEAEHLCDRIIMMHNGKIIAQGRVDELKAEYGTKSIRNLFFLLADIQEESYEV